jgi:arabinogalactan oligomer/maltooligosaccharide transport system permease protein
LNNRSKATPYLLIIPAILILIAIVGYPLYYGIRLSFTNMNLYHFKNPQFIGLNNYKDILADPLLYSTALRTIVWTVINVFFHVLGGLTLALLLNRRFPLKNFYRVLLMIPWAMPQYIATVTWKNMFRGQYGTIDILLNAIGIHNISWLQDPQYTFIAAIITNIWLGIPFMMTVILGGLQSIPNEMYEAAEIDGVGAWSRLKNITLPLLKPVLVPAVTLGTIWTFNMVNIIFIFTDNAGQEATQILVTKVYRDAFTYYAYGRAASFSVIIFLMLALFSIFFIKTMKGSEGVYE